MSFASHMGSGSPARSGSARPRTLEIVGVVAAFFYFWPLAVAYLGWKFMGYPLPSGLADEVRRNARTAFGGFDAVRTGRWNASPFEATSGNRAFDDYRRAELERLEAERRKLDEEVRGFRDFVDDLKRAKDREEFDAYMARRRASGGAN